MFGLRAIAVPLHARRHRGFDQRVWNRRSLEITDLKNAMLSALAHASENIRLMLPA